MEKFKVGDYVIITYSEKNWNEGMNEYIGNIVEITSIYSSSDSFSHVDGTAITFKNDGGWEWCYEDGHFIKPKSPNNIDDEILFQEFLLQNTNKESKFSDIDIDVKTGFITQKSKEIIPNIDGIKPKRKKVEYQSITIKINNKP